MFRHVVMLRWKADATAEQRSAVHTRLSALPGLVPELRNYVIGLDAGMNDGNYDMVIVADFDDVDGYLVYRDHPDHQAVIRECIQPILAERAAVQHEGVGES
jgi:Stress responsive A/B Barrel Domain